MVSPTTPREQESLKTFGLVSSAFLTFSLTSISALEAMVRVCVFAQVQNSGGACIKGVCGLTAAPCYPSGIPKAEVSWDLQPSALNPFLLPSKESWPSLLEHKSNLSQSRRAEAAGPCFLMIQAIGTTMPSLLAWPCHHSRHNYFTEGDGGTNFPFASISGAFAGCRVSDIIKTHLSLAFQHEMRMCWESRALPAFREEQFKY